MIADVADVPAPFAFHSVVEKLAAVDWDFPERVAHGGIEGIHPYPAKFIAEIPRALLDALPVPPGTAVLDPFCGSGTTLVECQRRGLPSVGIDLNPIACLMTKVKTSPQPDGLKEAAHATVALARCARETVIPRIPKLDHWFDRHVQIALAALSDAITTAPTAHRDALRLALSSIIVRVSNQESDTRYAAVEKDVATEDVFENFLRSVDRIHNSLEKRNYPFTPSVVLDADTLSVDPARIGRRIGMIITSPPYPNAYEYWLYHKYRMYWLGFDPIFVREREIGARAHFFKRNHHTEDDFVKQMTQTFELIRKVLVQDGYACIVVGRSRIHGRIVDNARIVKEAARAAGFSCIFHTERNLRQNRKSFNLSHANIKKESLLVLRRGTLKCT